MMMSAPLVALIAAVLLVAAAGWIGSRPRERRKNRQSKNDRSDENSLLKNVSSRLSEIVLHNVPPSDSYRSLKANPNTPTPTASDTKSQSPTQNSCVLLMSGHTSRARANSTRSELFVGISLAISLSHKCRRPLRPAQRLNCSKARRVHEKSKYPGNLIKKAPEIAGKVTQRTAVGTGDSGSRRGRTRVRCGEARIICEQASDAYWNLESHNAPTPAPITRKIKSATQNSSALTKSGHPHARAARALCADASPFRSPRIGTPRRVRRANAESTFRSISMKELLLVNRRSPVVGDVLVPEKSR